MRNLFLETVRSVFKSVTLCPCSLIIVLTSEPICQMEKRKTGSEAQTQGEHFMLRTGFHPNTTPTVSAWTLIALSVTTHSSSVSLYTCITTSILPFGNASSMPTSPKVVKVI